MSFQPTLKQLRYLCAVAEKLHFGRASKACFVTQSTLSAGILELERGLGCRLLERDNRRVMLTPTGRETVERAQRILEQVEALSAAARGDDRPMSRPMRCGVIPTIAPFVLPGVLAELRERYPQLQVMIREGLSASLLEGLRSGELDLVLLALPYPTRGLETMPLFDEPFRVAFHASHPLAGRDAVDGSVLERERMLLLEDGHCLRDHALQACRLGADRVTTPFQATSLHTLVQMVANGIGITLLPEMACTGGMLDGLPVDTRPLDEDAPTRSIALVWRGSSSRADEFRRFGEVVRERFPA